MWSNSIGLGCKVTCALLEPARKPVRAMRINYSIIFVADMSRSVAFYRDVLGIPLKFESPEWTEFAVEGANLALHKADADLPGTNPPDAKRAGTCGAGFQVPDLEAFHQRMIEQGVVCVQESTETFGVSIARYADPDGLVLSVSGV
jgi:lactoylglutathione lyase